MKDTRAVFKRVVREYQKADLSVRICSALLVVSILSSLALTIYEPLHKKELTSIASYSELLGKPIDLYASKLQYDSKKEQYIFNNDYTPGGDVSGDSIAPKITASFGSEKDKYAVTVNDPVNGIGITFVPKFAVGEPSKDQNRISYDILGRDALKVYSAKGSGIKEDIILRSKPNKDMIQFDYDVQVPAGVELRMEGDGSIGVYGVNKSLLGNVSTATDQDAELLKSARQNGEKNTLLFTIPAPFIVEQGGKKGNATAWFSLKDNVVSLYASGLKNASYPLSIDPTIYVETAQKLMRGNNETNVDFDTTNDLIQKSQTTGARIDGWADSTDMAAGVWDHSIATAAGYVYRAGGRVDPTMPYIVGTQKTLLGTAGTSFTVNMPTIRPAGDLYVILIAHTGTGVVTPPAGWTEYADIREHAAYYKIGTDQGGGNESASYTFTGSSSEWAGVVVRIKGFDSVTPITGAATTGSSASAVVPVLPAVTPSVDASLVISSVGINVDKPDKDSYTWLPNGFTKVASDASSASAASAGIVVATLDQPPLASNASTATSLASDGILIDTYGASSIAVKPATVTAGYQNTVEWAQFDPTTLAVDSPNPGTGVCASWCNNSAYNLPANRVGMSMLAYNGYLYALGGTPDGVIANGTSTVWIAKLGANGEPQLWHPSGGTPVYWYASTNTLPTALSYAAITAYKNRLYLLGGRDVAGNSISAVRVADLLPTGDISSWSTSGVQDLTTPSARFGHSVQVYNDVMYVIGGNNNGTLLNTVYYSKISTAGVMSPWVQTSSFTTGRASYGGQMTGVLGAYIYLAGGCSALTSGLCSTIASDVQLVSINADGTLAPWNPILTLSNQRIGYSFVAWQGGLYRFGGCNRLNTGTGACYATHRNVEFGLVNPSGDASTVRNSEKAGIGGCNGASPLNCDLPDPGDGAGQGGQMSSMVVINNGYIYNIGGCTDVTVTASPCTAVAAMSGNVAYASLNSVGQLTKPATCNTGYGINAGAGTITQSGNAVTGSGTGWTSSIVGSTIVYQDGSTTTVSTFTSATSITVAASKTIGTAQTYSFSSLWCVDSTNRINGTAGVGSAAATVFNNTIYVVGGTDGSNTWTSNIYYVGLNADGSLASNWTTAGTGTTGLPTTFPTVNAGGTAVNLSVSGIGYGYTFARANPASASSTPGNLYYLGGCVGTSGIGCAGPVATNAYSNGVYKCNINTDGSVTGCTTTGQLQIDADDLNAGNQGLGLMAGTVYANYIYLVGGACVSPTGSAATDPCGSTYSLNRRNTIYAKIDNNNNIVAAVTATWKKANAVLSPTRRRAVAFGYNGYIYSLAGFSGTASLQDLLFAKINVSSGDVEGIGAGSNFDSSGVVVTPRWDLRAIVSNGYVYAIGGCSSTTVNAPQCNSLQSQIQTFQLYNNDSGTPVNFAASANQFANDRMGSSSTILNGVLYVAGGCTSPTDCTATTADVQYATIDVNGALSTWSTGNALPAARAWGQLETVGGSLYYIGGQTNTATDERSEVYYTTAIAGGGNPTWAGTPASNGLPAERTKFSATVWDDRIYVAGGLDVNAAASAVVYMSPKLTSGNNITSAWTTLTSFNVARSGHSLVAYANNLYVMGGFDGTNYLNDVQFSTIGYKAGTISQTGVNITGVGTNWTSAMIGATLQYRDGEIATIQTVPSTTTMTVTVSKTVTAGSGYTIQDGSISSWSYTTSLPTPISQADAFAANGYLYLVGGRSSNGDCTPNTLLAPISANTTIASGNNATGIGEWYETNVAYAGERYGNSVAYANGKMYITGGACESTPTVSSVSSQTVATASFTHNITMPAVVDPGDLLIVLFTNPGGTVTDPDAGGPWTQISTQTRGASVRGSVWAIDAVGNEDGTTVNFATSTSVTAAAQVYRIPAAKWEGNIASVSATSVDPGANTAAPDPPSHTPAWGSANNLWITYAAGSTYASVTTYPSGTTNGLHTVTGTGGTGASVSSSQQESTTATLNPGAYAMAASNPGVAFTIAVRPAAFAYTGSNRTVQTAVYSQPQVAAYSRMIDTDTDVFPTSWLMNGLDNSIGARWQVKYSTMHDINPTLGGSDSVLTTPPSTYTLQQNPNEDCGTSTTMPVMTTWGQETNYGNVTLGDVATYTPKNGSGGNINCARYYYFYISIDASQTFGYPEDVNRGPTISDLSLFFTSDPSKRLRHGKTFTGGEQQPLDTPCRQSVDAQCPLP